MQQHGCWTPGLHTAVDERLCTATSTDTYATFTTRDGPDARSIGKRRFVRWKAAKKLTPKHSSKPLTVRVVDSPIVFSPALLTRMSSRVCRAWKSVTNLVTYTRTHVHTSRPRYEQSRRDRHTIATAVQQQAGSGLEDDCHR